MRLCRAWRFAADDGERPVALAAPWPRPPLATARDGDANRGVPTAARSVTPTSTRDPAGSTRLAAATSAATSGLP